MFKVIGAVFIIVSTAAIGISGVLRLGVHLKNLEAITVSLELMKNEIATKYSPMRDVLEFLSENAPTPACKLYKNILENMSRIGKDSFFIIWRDSVNMTGELLLTEEEAAALTELGLSLGRYNAHEQLEAIGRVIKKYDAFTKRAGEEKRKDSRAHAFLGITAGVFAVTVLI